MKKLFPIIALTAITVSVLLLNGRFAPAVTVNANGNCATTNTCNLNDANDFSQYCNANTAICNQVDLKGDATTLTVTCPSNTQTISAVYVHGGNGTTVYTLYPTSNTSYFSVTLQNSYTAVIIQTNKYTISWGAVICSNVTPTPTLTVSPTTTVTPTTDPCANNACVTPTVTTTPTVTLTVTVTPTTDPCANNACVTPTVTDTPTPTPTTIPTVTPTPTSNNGGNGGSSNGGSSSSSSTTTTQAVLGASTMAETGTFTENLMNILLIAGIISLAAGSLSYAKENRN